MKCFFKVLFVLPVVVIAFIATLLQIPIIALAGLLFASGCFDIDFSGRWAEPIVGPVLEWYREL